MWFCNLEIYGTEFLFNNRATKSGDFVERIERSSLLLDGKKSIFENIDLTLIIMEGQVINIDPEILGGTPVFFGTRVPIKNLFDYLETGDSIETFLEDFEGVSKKQVVTLLEMSLKLIETSTNILHENFA